MKIVGLEVIKVKPRWMFLKMHTDADITGLGEPVLEGHCNAVEAVIGEFEEYLIGKDPMQIEHHIQALYRGGFYRGGPLMMSAISGIEQAMWDIKGKYYNCPVYELIGGKCRDKIRMYTHIKLAGTAGDFPIKKMLDMAQSRLDEGYTALKYSIIPPIKPIESPENTKKHVERFAAVREKIGSGIDLAIDFHGRGSPATVHAVFYRRAVPARKRGLYGEYCTFDIDSDCGRGETFRKVAVPRAYRETGR